MKNNTNQIMKLDLPIWIKYWLAKHKNISYILSEILTGTEFFLQDSAPKKFKMFDIIGRSVQDGDPTPENPVPIKNTGDNGSVNEEIQNKNLFDENAVTFTTGVLDDNGNPTGSTASHYTNNFYQVNENNVYTLSGTFKIENTSARIYFYDKDKNWISRSAGFAGTSYTFTTPVNCKYIRIQVDVSITLKTGDVQLEQGSTATDYIAHAEQKISFPLAQGQKLMEGDYLADDGVHHVEAQIVLNGTENFVLYNGCFQVSQTPQNIGSINEAKCNTYLFNPVHASITSALNNYEFGWNNSKALTIRDDRFSSAEDFKAYLAEQYTNETPIKIQYELAEETTEDFTEEQKTAWEEIKKARTYKNITHISSEDETPAELKIQYYKEG